MDFMEEHHRALEYDLLQNGYELKDVGHSLSWGALLSFIQNLGPGTATARELNPELDLWGSRLKTNMILADIFDMLAMINANLIAVGSRKASKKPKPYPRPKKDNGNRYGKDAIKVEDLRKLFAGKRKKHGK